MGMVGRHTPDIRRWARGVEYIILTMLVTIDLLAYSQDAS